MKRADAQHEMHNYKDCVDTLIKALSFEPDNVIAKFKLG